MKDQIVPIPQIIRSGHHRNVNKPITQRLGPNGGIRYHQRFDAVQPTGAPGFVVVRHLSTQIVTARLQPLCTIASGTDGLIQWQIHLPVGTNDQIRACKQERQARIALFQFQHDPMRPIDPDGIKG